MDEDGSEGFRVVGLETLDHELHGGVVHIRQTEVGHIENDSLYSLVLSTVIRGMDIPQSRPEEPITCAPSQ